MPCHVLWGTPSVNSARPMLALTGGCLGLLEPNAPIRWNHYLPPVPVIPEWGPPMVVGNKVTLVVADEARAIILLVSSDIQQHPTTSNSIQQYTTTSINIQQPSNNIQQPSNNIQHPTALTFNSIQQTFNMTSTTAFNNIQQHRHPTSTAPNSIQLHPTIHGANERIVFSCPGSPPTSTIPSQSGTCWQCQCGGCRQCWWWRQWQENALTQER